MTIPHGYDVPGLAARSPHQHHHTSVENAIALEAPLAIVETIIFQGQRRPFEHMGRGHEIKPALSQGPFTLARIIGDFYK
jgi:hypothetical protein